jgi:hypothetical protein
MMGSEGILDKVQLLPTWANYFLYHCNCRILMALQHSTTTLGLVKVKLCDITTQRNASHLRYFPIYFSMVIAICHVTQLKWRPILRTEILQMIHLIAGEQSLKAGVWESDRAFLLANFLLILESRSRSEGEV